MCYIFLAFRVYHLVKKKTAKSKLNQINSIVEKKYLSKFVLFKFEQLSECLQDPMENLGS